MAPGKNLPQSAQSDSFHYLLISLLLQAGKVREFTAACRQERGRGRFSSPKGQKTLSGCPGFLHPDYL